MDRISGTLSVTGGKNNGKNKVRSNTRIVFPRLHPYIHRISIVPTIVSFHRCRGLVEKVIRCVVGCTWAWKEAGEGRIKIGWFWGLRDLLKREGIKTKKKRKGRRRKKEKKRRNWLGIVTQIARRPRRRQAAKVPLVRRNPRGRVEGGNEDRGKRRSVDREGASEWLREQVSSVTGSDREGERGFAKALALAPPLANGKAQGFACLPPRWPISNLAGCAASKVDQSVNPAEKRAFLAATLPRPNSFRCWPEAEACDHEPFHAR